MSGKVPCAWNRKRISHNLEPWLSQYQMWAKHIKWWSQWDSSCLHEALKKRWLSWLNWSLMTSYCLNHDIWFLSGKRWIGWVTLVSWKRNNTLRKYMQYNQGINVCVVFSNWAVGHHPHLKPKSEEILVSSEENITWTLYHCYNCKLRVVLINLLWFSSSWIKLASLFLFVAENECLS